jgi:phosphotransferase system HPr-like phosphotransfer protein
MKFMTLVAQQGEEVAIRAKGDTEEAVEALI